MPLLRGERLQRIRRPASLVVVAILVVAGAAGWALIRANATQDAVPAGALRVVQRAFGADAQAQVAGGAGAQTRVFRLVASAERAMAPAAARAYASLVSRNATAAASTAALGVAWDRATTSITASRVLASTAASVRILVSVEDIFHIAGTPDDGSSRHESITIDPYVIDLGRARDGSWQIRQAAAQQPGSGI